MTKECQHPIRLEGVETWGYDDHKRPIYYCPDCKETWEK